MFLWRYIAHKRLHISVLIALAASGVVAGVVLSLILKFELVEFWWIVLVIFLLSAGFLWRRAWLVVIVIMTGILLGLWRGDIQLMKIQGYQAYINTPVNLSGTVSDDVTEGKHGEKQVELGDVAINDRALPEKVWLSLHTKTALKRSDHMAVKGVLKPGFGSFAASMSFASLARHTKGTDDARDIRDWFAANVRKVINEPEASLGLGFLVGQRSSLPSDLNTQLQVVGLTHIVVASGYNLSVLVRLARRVLSKVSKYLTAGVSLGLISGFILITGLSPSMSRAGLVTTLSLAVWYYGRKISPFILLPLVAAVTLMANPSFAWGDIGWYLSFAAFAGVMIVAPLMHHYFFGLKKPGFIRQTLGETLAALLMTAPIIMLVFGQYSAYALLSNLLVVPAIPYIMFAVFAGGVVSVILPVVAFVANLPATILLHYVTNVVQWVANFPDAQTEAAIGGWGLLGYYIALGLVGYYMWRKTKHNFRNDNLIE